MHYNPDTAAPELDIAQSIETTDNQNFTVKLNPGYKFQDGTDVKAKNFVDAWNWDADGRNGNLNSYFFEPIEGYADLQCGTDAAGEADCTGKAPKTEKMSGLKVVDDTHLHHQDHRQGLQPPRPARLHGLRAAARLVLQAIRRRSATKPIGAGPYKVDSVSDTEMVVSKFADYSGKNKPSRSTRSPSGSTTTTVLPTTTSWPTTSTSPTSSRPTG